MFVEIAEDVKVRNRRGEEVGVLQAGFKFQSIDVNYLASHVIEELGVYEMAKLRKREAFVFLLHGLWITVEREKCNIPLTVSRSWRYNI